MNLMFDTLQSLTELHNVIHTVHVPLWDNYEEGQLQLDDAIKNLRQDAYEPNDRLLFVMQAGDMYIEDSPLGLILRNIQVSLNQHDISPCFATIVTTNPEYDVEQAELIKLNSDDNQLNFVYVNTPGFTKKLIDHKPMSKKEIYEYGSINPLKINLNDMSPRNRALIEESKTFCIYPWIHLHAWPTGAAYPCCMSSHEGKLGNTKENTLEEIWNSNEMKTLRKNMLTNQPSKACERCYEQEEAGFFSGRLSANKHHGHHIARTEETLEDGTFNDFSMTYWDIRFSNLCNLSCRSCGHIFSSSWYKDQVALAGPEYAEKNKALNIAGRYETDIWEQLVPHLDYVEQIYFAGGEPLMMEEHYMILEELVKRERFDVRLIYNTNFTHVKLKDKSVFEYWKLFDSVAVGASLDAMGPRAEYIRKGTKWAVVEEHRRQMMEICPGVDFYISPTLSIMNAYHLPEFHRDWVEKGLLKPQDLNVNILQDPAHYRIDIATPAMKDELRQLYREHIEWLKPLDHLQRATVGFESAINFMDATDNSSLQLKFLMKTQELDRIRGESAINVLPELKPLLG